MFPPELDPMSHHPTKNKQARIIATYMNCMSTPQLPSVQFLR
jgi:hypothetical protein